MTVAPLPSPRQSARGNGRRRFAKRFLVALSLILALVVIAWLRSRASEEPAFLVEQASRALAASRFAASVEFASRVPRTDRRWPRAALIAGEAESRQGRFVEAAAFFDSVPCDGSPEGVLAALSLGDTWRRLGALTESEKAFRNVLRCDPWDQLATERLVLLLTLTGRRWEAVPYLQSQIETGSAPQEVYVILADPERPLENPEFIRECHAQRPQDPLVQLGMAVQELTEGRTAVATSLLRQVVETIPDCLTAQALLGELLIDGRPEEFAEWSASLPANADEDAEIWFAWGLHARQKGHLTVAARCFGETVRRMPNHRRGNYQLGQVLIALRGDPDKPSSVPAEVPAASFAARAQDLNALSQALERVQNSSGRSETSVRTTIELLEATGQIRLAYAWAIRAAAMFPSSQWPSASVERLHTNVAIRSWAILPAADLASGLDFTGWPGIETVLQPNGAKGDPSTAASPVRFRLETSETLDFTYFNGKVAGRRGARMQEQTGGGVGVLDFDRDGSPDLFFPQGGAWPADEDHPLGDVSSQDQLFRNRQGTRFEPVTLLAGLVDGDFGQGCAAGDLDNDGFPDLYVANIGTNRLWRNNGDGTFSRHVPEGLPLPQTWTTSCAMVDLNADGLPDLYDVNYVMGEQIYERVCNGRACSPRGFAGTPDDIWTNDGQGGLARHIPAAAEVDGKGLGIVAFVQETSAQGTPVRPHLFIANDQVPNFFLRNEPGGGTEDGLRLANEGFASGLAFNQDGLAMASMGVAADDADNDGLLDLFVTNFKDEYDSLYLQQSGGVFTDVSRSAGLRNDNFRYVGWGTQFLDADLDGASDLVAVNGHVDDYRDEGGDYQMPPQFYRNLGDGRFMQPSAADLGPYFGEKFLGRGLARLDWNGDGRMDFAVSNVNAAAALVSNATEAPGRFLNVRLVGTKSSRDAIGTTVEVRAGERRWIKQLVGGDGYMASNERVLQFGVGAAAEVDSIEVRWPSGSISRTDGVQTDDTLVFVEEGRAALTLGGENPSLVAVVPAKPENQDAAR